MPEFARGFRLRLANGQHLDGVEFPSGRALVLDDPERGLASAALSLAVLLTGYHGSVVEWPEDATSCGGHSTDERCSGCGKCPHVCHGCDGQQHPTTEGE